jgi:formylglycine-generating enzyme required for sulfatase activity/nucleoside phosphorylase
MSEEREGERPERRTLPIGRRRAENKGAPQAADVAVMTVLPVELSAARDALGLRAEDREKDEDGTVTWTGAVRSELLGRSYRVVLSCFGAAGNPGAAAATAGILAKHHPRAVLLVGIAAGLRGRVKIGEVVLSDRVVAYEPSAVVAPGEEERRPEIDRTAYRISQDVISYAPDSVRIEKIFRRIGGRFLTKEAGLPEGARAEIAASIMVRAATVASGEKLLRHASKLREVREEIHGKAEVGEMEAVGVVEACRRRDVPWLVIRGISDFGDELKDDRFHEFAARAAAAVMADFLARGLELGAAAAASVPRPMPSYPDEKTRLLSEELNEARDRQRKLRAKGADTSAIDREIQLLRREMREGGQLRAGDSLGDGRYLLLDQIGRGGFSIVWKAYDSERGADVAIKVLHTELAGDSVRRDRFFRGARRMMDLEGDGVVRVLDPHGEDGGYHYFVMELIHGGDLRRAVLEKRLSGERIIPVILRVGDALARAHQRGLIHRDIKPANILLDASGAPWLTDFDLVAGAADSTGGTRTDAALGTVGYAAPELLLNATKAGPRADVYGLGMTTVFGLRGSELRELFVHGAKKIVGELSCSAAIKVVLARAVSVEEEERFADAGEFCRALEEAWQATPGAAARIEEEGAARKAREAREEVPPDTVRTVKKAPESAGGLVARSPTHKLGKIQLAPELLGGVKEPSASAATSPDPGEERPGSGNERRYRRWISLSIAGAAALGASAFTADQISPFLRAGRPVPLDPRVASVGPASSQVARIASAAALASARPPDPPLSLDCPEGAVRIPETTFFMGAPDGTGESDEHPKHAVSLSSFCIDRFEVTVGQYTQCIAKPRDGVACSPAKSDKFCNTLSQHPINCVDFRQAETYCRWALGRLPTEAEWELTARGKDGRKYPWGNDPPGRQVCWNGDGNDFGKGKRLGTCPVGKYKSGATPEGVFDMAGNVAEWTADWYAPYEAARDGEALMNPKGPAERPANDYRVVRGGAFSANTERSLRAVDRMYFAADERVVGVGFRCARSLQK